MKIEIQIEMKWYIFLSIHQLWHISKTETKIEMRDWTVEHYAELLVITGRACKRILSGAQRNKNEEAAILEEMRSQGRYSVMSRDSYW